MQSCRSAVVRHRPTATPESPCVTLDPIREEEFESRWEAAPAIGLVIVFQLLLALVSRARDWKLPGLPW
jgi:hypothetical protein